MERTPLAAAAFGSVVLKALNALLGLAIGIVLARMLGPESFGRYSLALAVVFLLALPAQAGLPILLVREVAASVERQDWPLLSGLLRRVNQFGALLALLTLTACVLVLSTGTPWSPAPDWVLLWALILVAVVSLCGLRSAVVVGLGHTVEGQYPDKFVRPGVLLIGLALLPWLGQSSDSRTSVAMAIHAAAGLAALGFAIFLYRKRLPEAVASRQSQFETRAWLMSLAPLSLLAGLDVMNSYADIILLGWFDTQRTVGVYRVALQASMPVFFVLAAVNAVAGPAMAKAHAASDRRELQRVATWTARAGLLGALPAAAVLILFGRQILGFLFGTVYSSGSTALGILAAGQFVGVAAGSVGLLLNMSGHEKDTVVGSGIAVVVNLVLNLVLIPAWGMTGAATATTLSLVTWNLILIGRVRHRLGIHSPAWHSSEE